ARLQLEQRGDEHEELAARVEVEPPLGGEALGEGDHDRRHVDVEQAQLFLEDERQQQVERALEYVEVELEVAGEHRRGASASCGRGPWARPSAAPSAPSARPG